MLLDNDEQSPEEADAGEARGDIPLSIDAVWEALLHQHRREMLSFLTKGSEQVVDFDQLIEYLVEREAEARGERPARDSIEVDVL